MTFNVLIVMGISAGVFGVIAAVLCMLTMFFYFRLGSYVKKNFTKELEKMCPGVNCAGFSSPFHSNDQLLDNIKDQKLSQLRNSASKSKSYFLLCFGFTAVLVLLTLGAGTIFSQMQK